MGAHEVGGIDGRVLALEVREANVEVDLCFRVSVLGFPVSRL